MVYSKQELFTSNKQRSFTGEAQEAAFLLGGIGTGNVSIGSRGELRDWEIFNKPGKGHMLPNTFFAIWAKEEGKPSIAKVLESKLHPPHSLSHGYHPNKGAGLPRLEKSRLRGEYPIVHVGFEDPDLPVDIELEAYTPFVPLNETDSGIPGAYLTYHVTNTSSHAVEVSITGSLANPIGGIDYDPFGNLSLKNAGQNYNEFKQEEKISGLYFKTNKYQQTDLEYGNVALVTPNQHVNYKSTWLRGAWYDNLQEFWDDFAEDGRLTDLGYENPSAEKHTDTGSLGVIEKLQPGETKEIQFILSWYFPNRINGWSNSIRVKDEGREITRNHYATRFDHAWEVASYLMTNKNRLKEKTYQFKEALFSSTLPDYVLDAVSSNITVLRSTTCFWLEDGRFLGYEGCFDEWGCCDGNCTHVWNYAQTLAFLFPKLEQSMRKTEFLEEVHEDGKMEFRAMKMFDTKWIWNGQTAPPSADGQMGTIMKVYREWKFSGDDDFLKELWPSVKKALNYAFIQWDLDGDLVFDGEQHVTYDIEFYGPNPLTAVYFLGALRAAQEIARYLGEEEIADKYQEAFEKSSKRADELLWNGEYYVQVLEDVDQYKYQHGMGCSSDQLLAQQMAHIYGLGYLLPDDHVKSAIHAVFNHNYKTDFTDHVNCQRTYVLNDEKGLLLCSWPNGGRPKLPFVYSDEVWTGIEYHVATHLIYEGYIEEGLTLVKSVRDRHDGIKRNPWNEVECGHHYVRSMSSWGLLTALSGYQFDMVKNEISFNPVINKDQFTTFWSTGNAWGTFTQEKNKTTDEWEINVEILYGDATGMKVNACGKQWVL